MNNYVGKYLKILDKKSNSIVASGKIVFQKEGTDEFKDQPLLVSLDNKYFYNINGTKHYYCIILDNEISLQQNIPSNYKIKRYRWMKKPPYNADIYRDFGIDELDKDVEPLVKALNKIDGITTVGSCSGHFVKELWVDMYVLYTQSYELLKFIIKEFEKHFELNIKSDFSENRQMMLELKSKHKGYTAYKYSNQLSQYIEEHLTLFQ